MATACARTHLPTAPTPLPGIATSTIGHLSFAGAPCGHQQRGRALHEL
jgi:hypothetical protein